MTGLFALAHSGQKGKQRSVQHRALAFAVHPDRGVTRVRPAQASLA